MKKFLFLAVAAIGLLVTACTKDETAPVAQEEMSAVTFTVAGPEMGTRATYGDGYTATHLTWGVYDADGNYLEDLSAEGAVGVDFPAGSLSTTVKIDLVNGKEYKVIFWAGAEGAPYTVDFAEKEMTVSDTLVANAEAYDAFYKYEEIETVAGPRTETIELTRPFAQLNIATADTEKAAQGGLVVKQTKVVVNAYKTLNLETGAVDNEVVERTYDYADILTGEKINGYDLLSMNYILVNEKELETVKFTVKNEGFEQEYTYENVPLQRNYRTNIIGNLLTSTIDFDIEILPGFATEEHDVEVVYVASAQDLQEAINNATTGEETNITLTDDIDLNSLFSNTRAAETNTVTLAKGKKLVLNLNGFNLTGVDKTTKNYGLIQNNGNLTIIGPGSIKTSAITNNGWNRYSAVISNNPGAELYVGAGVEIEHLGGTDMSYGIDNLTNGTIGDVKATIDGATVKSTYRAIRQFLNSDSKKNELTIKAGSTVAGAAENYGVFFHDPSTKANNGTLIIEQGATVQGVYLFVTAGSTEWPVEFSIAASSITGEKGVVAANVPAGHAVGLVDGVYTKVVIDTDKYVAHIGAQGYETLQAAIEAAQEGDTVTLIRDIEQEDGVLITDKNITIDLNNKSFTVSEGASTNNRNFKINGESVVTIKNGTLVAEGELTSGAYGTIRTEDTATVTLNNVKLYSYRGYGLNVKAYAGTKVTINDSEIYSQYSGGVEAAGGEIVLSNVTIDQNGVYSGAAWCSVAIGVNGGGKVVVNSGTYSAKTIAEDANAAQGTWVAYVMSSGGTLEINGGTFTGGDSETANAANACGIICADRAAVVNIYGGTFNAQRAILDMRNNVGTQPNPIATLYDGDFSHNPTVSGLYSSNLIKIAEGKIAVQHNGRWTLVDGVATAEALAEAVAAGGNVVLGADITVDETVIIPEGKTVVLDLNGKTLSAADKNTIKNNGGILTIKNGTVTRTGNVVGYAVNNASGELYVENATVKVGLYTSGSKFVATNANISHEQSTRHAIYAYNCEVTLNGGTYHNGNAGNATLMAAGTSEVDIISGTFSIADGRPVFGWTSCLLDVNNQAKINITDGVFNGGFRVQSGTTMTINGGSFNDCYGSNYNIHGTTIVKGGTYTDAAAQAFAQKYLAEGYKYENGTVVAN